MKAEQYATMINTALTQVQQNHQMLENVKKQAAQAEEVLKNTEDKEVYALVSAAFDRSERLALHLDLKITILMNVVASYECAKQQAIANERVDAHRIKLI